MAPRFERPKASEVMECNSDWPDFSHIGCGGKVVRLTEAAKVHSLKIRLRLCVEREDYENAAIIKKELDRKHKNKHGVL